MLTLCGFPLSNYYNKVKFALLEKGVDFTEEDVRTGRKDEAVLAASPLGKIPFIRTEHGTLCESEAIMAYVEATWPAPALLPIRKSFTSSPRWRRNLPASPRGRPGSR